MGMGLQQIVISCWYLDETSAAIKIQMQILDLPVFTKGIL